MPAPFLRMKMSTCFVHREHQQGNPVLQRDQERKVREEEAQEGGRETMRDGRVHLPSQQPLTGPPPFQSPGNPLPLVSAIIRPTSSLPEQGASPSGGCWQLADLGRQGGNSHTQCTEFRPEDFGPENPDPLDHLQQGHSVPQEKW